MTPDPLLWTFAGTLARLLAVALGLVGLAAFALRRRQPALGRELWLRWVSWVGIATLVLATLALGRVAWMVLVGLLSGAAFREYARAAGLWAERGIRLASLGSLALLYVSLAAADAKAGEAPGWPGVFLAFPAYATLGLFLVPIARDTFAGIRERLGAALLGLLSCGWLLGHLVLLRDRPGGVGLVLLLLFLVSLHDVAAFSTGKLLGRHKLRAALSPGKTWEGATGALVATVIAAWLTRWLVPGFSASELLGAAALVSVAATLGDLALAALKRDLGLKDWSPAIPGHGGLLDRLNSLVFTAPLLVHYARLVGA